MVATVAVLGAVGLVVVGPGQIASAAAFVWDYSPAANGWWLGHTWSLSIEEQFYLLWPIGLLLMGARRASRFALVALLATPFVRVLSYLLLPGGHTHAWMMFHARSDALLLGCFLALAPSARPELWARLVRLAQLRRTEVLAGLALVVSALLERLLGGYWVMPFGYSLDALAAGALLTVVVARTTPSALTRAVRWRPLVAVGLVSYSLYLWQQLFFPPHGTPALPHVGSVALAVPTALAAATLSYLFVEKPFLTLKDRRQRRVLPLPLASPFPALGGAAGGDLPGAPATSGSPA
jgi:peptidoglycan/LPS O-acetylase OafA/YrhL